MKNYKILHISLTPLAGAPIRTSDALNKYTNFTSRSLNLNPHGNGKRTFKEDLIWGNHRKAAIEEIKNADILCFHHYFDFFSSENQFDFNFKEAMKPGAKMLLQWHSNPNFISETRGVSLEQIQKLEIPQIVVAQFHEPYYPNAAPVPLIVETGIEVPEQEPFNKIPLIFFAPSNGRASFEKRWETKGKMETLKVLKTLRARGVADYILAENIPFDQCMSLRKHADIVIDDVVTGSFHTSSLESLALGKTTISFLDHRTQLVLSELTGSTDLPLVNSRLEDLEEVLLYLCQNKLLINKIGSFSKEWMDRFYSEEKMTKIHAQTYTKLLEEGAINNPRYLEHRDAKEWLYKAIPDIEWKRRAKEHNKTRLIIMKFIKKLHERFLKRLVNCVNWISMAKKK